MGTKVEGQNAGGCWVSILVVLDWAWGPRRRTTPPSPASPFQSLLYWIGRGDDTDINGTLTLLRVSILVVLDWAWGPMDIIITGPNVLKFQSLLYWIGRGDGRATPGTTAPSKFQSLLYWIGRGDILHLGGA